MKVIPKTPRYRCGGLYKPVFNQGHRSWPPAWLFKTQDTNRFENCVGKVFPDDLIVFIEETSWGVFKVIHNDQVGWITCASLRSVSMDEDNG